MEQYRIEQDGNKITVWDDTAGVGLCFTQGDTLQRYTSELIIRDWAILQHPDTLSEISAALTGYTAERFPMEFEPIKTI